MRKPYLCFVFFVHCLIINCGSVGGKLSGIYVDNGLQQSVMAQSLTDYDDDKLSVEHEILELLDLPNRLTNHLTHPSLRKSAPQFLIDVYRRLNEEENGNRTTREVYNLLTDDDERAIDQSDIIMTFLNKNHHVAEVRHERGFRLWFDASKVSGDIMLTMAELRLYKNQASGKLADSRKTFTISAYTIVDTEGQKSIEIIAKANTTAYYQGWLELNVTNALEKWIKNNDSNEGIYISVHSVDKPDHEVKLENLGFVNTKGDEEYQPFIVGYFNGVQTIHAHTISRVKRNANLSSQKKKKKSDRNIINDWRPDNQKTCQLHTLYVSFQDLNWHDWIIAPNGFHAHYCSGECNFPLNAPTNPTNHAIVQTLVHLVSPTKVPKPCCVPTKLGAISVLYYLDDSNVVVKKYRNIVVKSCGCH